MSCYVNKSVRGRSTDPYPLSSRISLFVYFWAYRFVCYCGISEEVTVT